MTPVKFPAGSYAELCAPLLMSATVDPETQICQGENKLIPTGSQVTVVRIEGRRRLVHNGETAQLFAWANVRDLRPTNHPEQ